RPLRGLGEGEEEQKIWLRLSRGSLWYETKPTQPRRVVQSFRDCCSRSSLSPVPSVRKLVPVGEADLCFPWEFKATCDPPLLCIRLLPCCCLLTYTQGTRSATSLSRA
ncbi:unnamed protein product, partial [Hapterophycus canaliculatus]